jgi:hypothetical protein
MTGRAFMQEPLSAVAHFLLDLFVWKLGRRHVRYAPLAWSTFRRTASLVRVDLRRRVGRLQGWLPISNFR